MINEVVIVQQEGQPRNSWLLGKIIELDGVPARSAKVQIGKKIYVRPINKLFPLEVKNEEKIGKEKDKDESENNGEREESEKEKLNENLKKKRNNLVKEGNKIEKQRDFKINTPTHPMTTRSKAALALAILQLLLVVVLGNPMRKYPINNCRNCKLQCTDYGVKAEVNSRIGKIEICCLQDCLVSLEGKNSLKFNLPKEITSIEYTCKANYWEGERKFKGRANCPPINPCKKVSGIFEIIINIHCLSTRLLIILGIFIGIILSISISFILCFCKIVFVFGKILTLIWYLIKIVIGLFCKGKKRKKECLGKSLLINSEKGGKKDRRRNRRLNRLGLLVIICVFIPRTIADVEVSSVQVNSENCFKRSGSTFCTISKVNTITLLPDGQIASFTIKDHKGIIIGELEFVMSGLSIVCNEEVLAYLRSFETKIESVKRCPTEGSCKAGKCGNIKTNEILPELEEWTKYPGNVYCSEGQSLWGYKCGLPGSTCYFYKILAIPKSEEVFELINCPSWDYLVNVEMKLVVEGNSEKFKFSLHPGLEVHWKDFRITLWNLIPPMAPVLYSQFLVSNSGVAIMENFKYPLICGRDISNFSQCSLDQSVCKECWEDTELERISCACTDLSLEGLIQDPYHALPLDIKRIKLRNDGKKIYSETHYLPIQIMVKIQNWTISTNTDMTKCHINPIKLSGCYNCRGAIFKFQCKADMGDVLAEIKCQENIFTAHCSKRGIEQYAVLSFSREQIFENCEVKCPGGDTFFKLKGKLEFFLAERVKIIIKNGTPQIYNTTGNNKWLLDIFSTFQLIDFKGVDEVYGRLNMNKEDRAKVANAARKVENKNGELIFMNRGWPKGVITGVAEWILVGDNEGYAEYPQQINFKVWKELIALNKVKTQNYYFEEDKAEKVNTGPGLVFDNPLRGLVEFYPIEGVEIEEFMENNMENKNINENFNYGFKANGDDEITNHGGHDAPRTVIELEVIEGDLNKLKIDLIEGENSTVNMEAKPVVNVSSNGSQMTNLEVKIKARIFRGPLLGILYLFMVCFQQ
ncbi:Phlebovirus_G2 domain-containing protein [Meloidogyne graminicola]|uniref:Phlebovirus_G2 domain-containing protein n=1 Tax=Meloidogyne graminicola TaxID=189291 RepID=A0A8T0A0N0_9BILA|nr:Phlebovirus_G2 domain-containing protein [Meloidogyne graminicola]